jgi:hypothetical protein
MLCIARNILINQNVCVTPAEPCGKAPPIQGHADEPSFAAVQHYLM